MALVLERKSPSKQGSGCIGSDNGGDDFGRSGDGGDGDSGDGRPQPAVSANILGMIIFIASEIALFLALIVAFKLARNGQVEWPPPGQPRLPVGVTLLNTGVLFLSGYTVFRAWRDVKTGWEYSFPRWLLFTVTLGTLFLLIQGYEWTRLIGYGLSIKANLYGAAFYTIIGAHALHVLIAILMVVFVWRRALKGAYSVHSHEGIALAGLFWGFVVLIWPLLFVTVYLI